MSFFEYVRNEITRSYMLDHDQERYTSKREKMYTFMRIPRKPRNLKKNDTSELKAFLPLYDHFTQKKSIVR